MADNDEDARAQRQRALLHNAPRAPLREPTPGERLMTFEHGQDVYRVELRDFQPNGVETQIFQNGELLAGCRFTVRALAVHWADQKRAAILRSGAGWDVKLLDNGEPLSSLQSGNRLRPIADASRSEHEPQIECRP